MGEVTETEDCRSLFESVSVRVCTWLWDSIVCLQRYFDFQMLVPMRKVYVLFTGWRNEVGERNWSGKSAKQLR